MGKDRVGTAGIDIRVNNILGRVIQDFGLKDCWPTRHSDDPGHTHLYRSGSSRLDRFYIHKSKDSSVIHIAKIVVPFSDHCCVWLRVKTGAGDSTNTRNRRTHWKLNTTMLNEEEYIERVRKFIVHAGKHPLKKESSSLWWESVFKPGVKKISIDYGRQRKQWQKKTDRFYQEALEIAAVQPETHHQQLHSFRELQQEIQGWNCRKNKGVLIRSRAQCVQSSEEPSSYHFARERKKKAASSIESITKPDGSVITDATVIKETVIEFFNNQFNDITVSRREKEQSFNKDLSPTNLPLCTVKTLEAEITPSEVVTAINEMKTNKAPGIDGLPLEFYLKFWPELSESLVDTFNDAIRRGGLTKSQATALVTLIPKTTNPKSPRDYRPISVLCSDYKILAKTLSRRLEPTLQETIEHMQKGRIRGRGTQDVLLDVRDIVKLLESQQCRGALIAADFAKAYDKVARDLIWHNMQCLGYPTIFINMLKVLYVGCSAIVNYGTGATESIACTASIKQGCPLSVPLFLFYMEPLLRRFQAELTGIQAVKSKIKVRGFLDDVTIFAEARDDVHLAGSILEDFCSWTGARLNTEKTTITGIGAWNTFQDWQVDWATCTTEAKILGISFSSSIEKTIEEEWTRACRATVGVLKGHTHRILTIHDRAAIARDLGISKCVHLARVLPCPEKIATHILNDTVRFIWKGSLERTKREVIYRAEKEGGLNFPQPAVKFRALFAATNLSSLTAKPSTDAVATDVQRYWLAFHLKKELPLLTKNTQPYSILNFPPFLEAFVTDVQALIKAKEEIRSKGTTARNAYNILIADLKSPGKMELKWPEVKWEDVWTTVKRLPSKEKDFIFRLNHDVLPTKARLLRTQLATNGLCQFCRQDNESLMHLFVSCPWKKPLKRTLLKTPEELGFTDLQDHELLFMDLPKNPRKQQGVKATLAYFQLLWTHRDHRELPSPEDVEGKLRAAIRSDARNDHRSPSQPNYE